MRFVRVSQEHAIQRVTELVEADSEEAVRDGDYEYIEELSSEQLDVIGSELISVKPEFG